MIPDIKTENDLRILAGIPLKEVEGGSLDNILAKHREAFESVMRGDSLLHNHDEFYDELYGYFVNSGEMPYGIAKARDGDPDQWIQEYLDQEYGEDFSIDDMEHLRKSKNLELADMASAGIGTDEDQDYYGESISEGHTGPTRMEIQNYFSKQDGSTREKITATEKAFHIKDLKVDSKGQVVSYKLIENNEIINPKNLKEYIEQLKIGN